MRIAVIGYGSVGGALGTRLREAGHEVVFGVRDPESPKVQAFLDAVLPRPDVLPVPEALAGAEVILLATPWQAARELLEGAGDLGDRIVVDCTNPIGPGLTLASPPGGSGMETLIAAATGGRFVKAFNTYGFENFRDPVYPGYGSLRPAMFLCGDDAEARRSVGALCAELGFEPVETGEASMARHLEPLAMIWIRMARVQGRGAGFTWAVLRRP